LTNTCPQQTKSSISRNYQITIKLEEVYNEFILSHLQPTSKLLAKLDIKKQPRIQTERITKKEGSLCE